MLITPSPAAGEIAKALGLPRETRWLTLDLQPDHIATVTAEIFVKQEAAPRIARVLKRFNLVEIDEPADEPAEPLQTFARVRFCNGTTLVTPFDELTDVLEDCVANGHSYIVEHVQMTQSQFDNLGEFEA